MSVSMMPGFNGTAAMLDGNSCASAWVNPSMAHLVAQYGATKRRGDQHEDPEGDVICAPHTDEAARPPETPGWEP